MIRQMADYLSDPPDCREDRQIAVKATGVQLKPLFIQQQAMISQQVAASSSQSLRTKGESSVGSRQ